MRTFIGACVVLAFTAGSPSAFACGKSIPLPDGTYAVAKCISFIPKKSDVSKVHDELTIPASAASAASVPSTVTSSSTVSESKKNLSSLMKEFQPAIVVR